MTVYLNLGSNLGNRLGNINKAVALFSGEEAVEKDSIVSSQIIETEPWGYSSVNNYLNIGLKLEFKANFDVEAIFDIVVNIQEKVNKNGAHRTADGAYADRLLDIDIIAIEELVYESEHLSIPHPRMQERDFVLQPMIELAPFWIHPRMNKTAAQLLAQIKPLKPI